MSLPPSSLPDSDISGRGSTCCGSGVSCHPIQNLPGPVRHDDRKNDEELLDELRQQADWMRTVYGDKGDVLSLSALSKLQERWEDVSKTIEKIKTSLAEGTDGHVEMHTAPLVCSDYVKDEEISDMEPTYTKIRIFREGGTLAQEIKELKRPSRGSARWEEKSRQYDTLIYCHNEYSKQVQDFVDSVTLDGFRVWLRQVRGSEDEQAKIQKFVEMETELGSAIDRYNSEQNNVINSPSCATCASEQDSMMDRSLSAVCV